MLEEGFPRRSIFPSTGTEGATNSDGSQSLSTAATHYSISSSPTPSIAPINPSQTVRHVSSKSQSLNPTSHENLSASSIHKHTNRYATTTALQRKASPAPATRSLADFLSSFPLPFPSTDTLISRISLDSNDTDPLEQDHEMDVMRPLRAEDGVEQRTSRTRLRSADDKRRAGIGGVPDAYSQHHPSTKGIRCDDMISSTVRTEQMRPSPRMRLPIVSFHEAN